MGQCGKGLECRSNQASFFPEFDVGVCVRKQLHVRRTKLTTPPQPPPGLKHVRLNPPASRSMSEKPPKQVLYPKYANPEPQHDKPARKQVVYPQFANPTPQQDKPAHKEVLYNPIPGKQRLYLVPKSINNRLYQYTAPTLKPSKILPTPTANIQ